MFPVLQVFSSLLFSACTQTHMVLQHNSASSYTPTLESYYVTVAMVTQQTGVCVSELTNHHPTSHSCSCFALLNHVQWSSPHGKATSLAMTSNWIYLLIFFRSAQLTSTKLPTSLHHWGALLYRTVSILGCFWED